MFKVSFKETKDNPTKYVTKGGKKTVVYLVGKVKLPEFWSYVPSEIMEWIGNQNKLEIYEHINENCLEVYSKGVAKCREEDKYDSILGERLAEARAKYNIYYFFQQLSFKLYDYYDKILFGSTGTVDANAGGLSDACKKYEALCIHEAHHIGELLKSKYHE